MVSSESTWRMYSPVAREIPRLRVSDTPELGKLYSLILGSFSEKLFTISVVSSVEPSFTMITSKSGKDCVIMLSRHSRIVFAELYTGMIIENKGVDAILIILSVNRVNIYIILCKINLVNCIME